MILLISDLHLEEERPDITRAFLDLLASLRLGRLNTAYAGYGDQVLTAQLDIRDQAQAHAAV
ncbi:hypothetical protein ACQKP7_14940, partial [Pseudomonas frederiksbergensis]